MTAKFITLCVFRLDQSDTPQSKCSCLKRSFKTFLNSQKNVWTCGGIGFYVYYIFQQEILVCAPMPAPDTLDRMGIDCESSEPLYQFLFSLEKLFGFYFPAFVIFERQENFVACCRHYRILLPLRPHRQYFSHPGCSRQTWESRRF